MRWVLASARSAPGVTTATLALASALPGRLLVVEASEDGGVLAARFGLPPEPSMASLAAATRNVADPAMVWEHTQALPGTDGRIQALVAPPGAEAAQTLLRATAGRLAQLLDGQPETTVLIDAGRLPPAPAAAPLIAGWRLVVVTRPRVEELQALAARLPVLRELDGRLRVLLVGDRPYGSGEVASALGVDVVGVLADDRAAADALAGASPAGGLTRSRLLRSAATVADRLNAPDTRVPSVNGSDLPVAEGGLWPSLTARTET